MALPAAFGLGARFALLSRETLLLGNNVMLVVACGAVLLGIAGLAAVGLLCSGAGGAQVRENPSFWPGAGPS